MAGLDIVSRAKHAWNAFINNRDPTFQYREFHGGSYYRPDRHRYSRGNERSFVTSILNRIANDAAAIDIRHVRLDKDGRYLEDMDSTLNECLTLRANKDQTARAFRLDIYQSLFDEGCIAIVPVDIDRDPKDTEAYKILSMRTGKITEWFPDHVRVNVYNDRSGKREDIICRKDKVSIVETPFYQVMNEPNSTFQRLVRKLNLLDAIDEQSGSGKLDLIIQLPYVIKSQTRKQQAEDRRKDIENQLAGSKYGIAYTDGTERITQLNRPVENNLMKQIEYLTSTLYGQLGITQTIMDGTADEKTMLNYNNRIIEVVVAAVVDAMKSIFLSTTARSQKQSILYFRDPFRLVPIDNIAEIADKFTRNEIMSSNEIRQIVGLKPSKDPKADQLVNSNISQPEDKGKSPEKVTENSEEGGKDQNGDRHQRI